MPFELLAWCEDPTDSPIEMAVAGVEGGGPSRPSSIDLLYIFNTCRLFGEK